MLTLIRRSTGYQGPFGQSGIITRTVTFPCQSDIYWLLVSFICPSWDQSWVPLSGKGLRLAHIPQKDHYLMHAFDAVVIAAYLSGEFSFNKGVVVDVSFDTQKTGVNQEVSRRLILLFHTQEVLFGTFHLSINSGHNCIIVIYLTVWHCTGCLSLNSTFQFTITILPQFIVNAKLITF